MISGQKAMKGQGNLKHRGRSFAQKRAQDDRFRVRAGLIESQLNEHPLVIGATLALFAHFALLIQEGSDSHTDTLKNAVHATNWEENRVLYRSRRLFHPLERSRHHVVRGDNLVLSANRQL